MARDDKCTGHKWLQNEFYQLSKITINFYIRIVRINFLYFVLKMFNIKRVYMERITHPLFNLPSLVEHKVDLIVHDKVVEFFCSGRTW